MDEGGELKTKHNPHHNENTEWYTPSIIIEAARDSMGSIDLDVASCEEANRVVKASRYFTVKDDGLSQKWEGNVWCNPPYKRTPTHSIGDWWFRIKEYEGSACMLLHIGSAHYNFDILASRQTLLFINSKLKLDWWGPGSIPINGKRLPTVSSTGPWGFNPLAVVFHNCEPSEYARKLGAVR